MVVKIFSLQLSISFKHLDINDATIINLFISGPIVFCRLPMTCLVYNKSCSMSLYQKTPSGI